MVAQTATELNAILWRELFHLMRYNNDINNIIAVYVQIYVCHIYSYLSFVSKNFLFVYLVFRDYFINIFARIFFIYLSSTCILRLKIRTLKYTVLKGTMKKLTYEMLIWLNSVVCFWNFRRQFLFPVGSLQIEWAGNKTLLHNIIPSVFSPKGGDAVTQYRRGVRFSRRGPPPLYTIRGVVGGDGKRAPPTTRGQTKRCDSNL